MRDGGPAPGRAGPTGSPHSSPTESMDDTVWDPAPRRRLSEEVVARVREAIVSGRLRPGQRVIEVELAERLRVSKAPVREALRELEREGLIQIQPHHGSYVRALTPKDVRELVVMRTLLEGAAVEMAMARSNEAWLSALDDHISRMRSARSNAELTDVHLAFHELLVKPADNALLARMLENLWSQVRTFLAFVDLLYPDAKSIAEDHAALMEVVRSGDTERARKEIDRHIAVAGAELEAIWQERFEGSGASVDEVRAAREATRGPTQ